MKPSAVTDLLFQQLSFRADRQKVISSNIANINTPGYKTKDLVFENELQKVNAKKNGDLELKVTHSGHIPFISESIKPNRPKVVEVPNLNEQNDGNNVSLDKQISEQSKNNVMFSALQSAIKKDAAWLKEIIASSGKN